jgi:hypothetical protein
VYCTFITYTYFLLRKNKFARYKYKELFFVPLPLCYIFFNQKEKKKVVCTMFFSFFQDEIVSNHRFRVDFFLYENYTIFAVRLMQCAERTFFFFPLSSPSSCSPEFILLFSLFKKKRYIIVRIVVLVVGRGLRRYCNHQQIKDRGFFFLQKIYFYFCFFFS